MGRPVWPWRGCVLGLLGLVAAIALVPHEGMIWDGGFRSAEYRLRFVDKVGHPVPGVTLRVITRAGGDCHLYPINEFLPGQVPTSDADGRMVFHHVAESLEFAGRVHWNLAGIAVSLGDGGGAGEARAGVGGGDV